MTRLHQSQLTWPMWRQFSSPTTSISLSPMSWLAPLSSALSFSPCGLRRDFFLCCLNTTDDTPLTISASKSSIRRFVITEKARTRAFSWLKAATTACTFKTLLRHYAKRALTPQSLNVNVGPRRNYHKGRAAIRHYANPPPVPYDYCVVDPISRQETVGSTPV